MFGCLEQSQKITFQVVHSLSNSLISSFDHSQGDILLNLHTLSNENTWQITFTNSKAAFVIGRYAPPGLSYHRWTNYPRMRWMQWYLGNTSLFWDESGGSACNAFCINTYSYNVTKLEKAHLLNFRHKFKQFVGEFLPKVDHIDLWFLWDKTYIIITLRKLKAKVITVQLTWVLIITAAPTRRRSLRRCSLSL